MVLAHGGHWLANLLYSVPFLVLAAMLALDKLRGGQPGQDELPEPSLDDVMDGRT